MMHAYFCEYWSRVWEKQRAEFWIFHWLVSSPLQLPCNCVTTSSTIETEQSYIIMTLRQCIPQLFLTELAKHFKDKVFHADTAERNKMIHRQNNVWTDQSLTRFMDFLKIIFIHIINPIFHHILNDHPSKLNLCCATHINAQKMLDAFNIMALV